jgi:hypothetical protein
MAPFVPQKTKFGVLTIPWGVVNLPHLALDFDDRWVISNEN